MPSTKSSWRDVLSIHPAADLFPMMSPDELKTLGADIKANGLKTAIAYYSKDRGYCLVDGRNRLDAMEIAGLEPGFKIDRRGRLGLTVNDDDWDHGLKIPEPESVTDPWSYAVSVNIHRRHLTAGQKRELIANLLKAQPTKSNRQIGEQTKADHKTVASVRAEKEATGEIPQLTKTVGKDGKARSQPKPQRHTADNFVAERKAREALAAKQETPSWTADQAERKAQAERGLCVVANMHDGLDVSLLAWAKTTDRFVRIDRITDWGNPFEMPDDGSRDEVVANFANHYLPYKKGLLRRLPDLRGKVLGCWCHPEQCHGHAIAEVVNSAAAQTSADDANGIPAFLDRRAAP